MSASGSNAGVPDAGPLPSGGGANRGDDPILDVRDLAVSFDSESGEVYAVRGVSFTVRRGETLGVVGESGSGKSATALALLRLLPVNGHVTAGSAIFEGRDLITLPTGQLNELRGGRVAMIYQDPLSALNPVLTVGRQLTEVIERHERVSHRAAEKRAVEILELVGIPNPERRIREYPHQFSGGMRQRVMIAMAISCRPRLLIADEPTTALDVTVQAQILELLGRLKQELGMGLIIITHDLGVVAGIAERVAIMYAGRIVEYGAAEQVLDDPQHPYTLGLLNSVPRLDQPRRISLQPIPGSPPDASSSFVGCPFAPRCPYRIDRCAGEDPPLLMVGTGRSRACWVDVGSAARSDS